MCIENAVNVGGSVAVMRGEVQGLCSECIYDGGIINAEYFLLSCSICEHSFCVKNFCGLPANVSFKNKPLTGTWKIWIKHSDTNIIRKDHTRRF